MHMFDDTANAITSATRVARYLGEVGMKGRTNSGREKRLAVLGTKHHVHEDMGE
jgi:hypothetical protein